MSFFTVEVIIFTVYGGGDPGQFDECAVEITVLVKTDLPRNTFYFHFRIFIKDFSRGDNSILEQIVFYAYAAGFFKKRG